MVQSNDRDQARNEKKNKPTNKQINVLSLNKRMVILVYNQHGKEYVEVIENIKKIIIIIERLLINNEDMSKVQEHTSK